MEPIDVLRKMVAASTQQAVADQLKISRQLVGMMVTEQRAVSDDVARKLGYEKVTVYRKVR